MCACLCGLLLLPAIYLHLSIHDVHGGFHVCDCVSMLSLHRCIKPRMYVQMYVVLLVCVGVSVCVCMQLFFSCKYVPQLFRPSHPSRRPIFSLSRSQTTTPLFTADVSLVPCPISHNPLPRFQEPMFAYCPPHLFYIANSPQHPPLSPFIFGQLSLFTPPPCVPLVCSTSTSACLLSLHPAALFFSIHFKNSPRKPRSALTLLHLLWITSYHQSLIFSIFQPTSFLFPTTDGLMQGARPH